MSMWSRVTLDSCELCQPAAFIATALWHPVRSLYVLIITLTLDAAIFHGLDAGDCSVRHLDS